MQKENFKVPEMFQCMNSLQYTDVNSDNYMWLFDMEWISVDNLFDYQYEERESRYLVPFAYTGGDRWAWFIKGPKEYPIVLCHHDDYEGEFYAKNLSDAIYIYIIEFVSGDNFYLEDRNSDTFQISYEELQKYLKEWKDKLGSYFTKEQLNVLKNLIKENLFICDTKFGKWCVLISPDKAEILIKKYADFELRGQTIQWMKD